MWKIGRLRAAGALGFAVVLTSGCASFRWPWEPPPPPGCEVNYVKGAEWNLGGLKLPINAYGLGTVEVANIKYTGPQAQTLSDSVSAMDQGRRGLCTIIASRAFETMSEKYRAEKFDAMLAINRLIVSYGIDLSKVQTVEAGLALAKSTKEKADVIVPPETFPPQSETEKSSHKVTGLVDAVARKDVAILQSDVKVLYADVKALTASGQVRLQVQPFEPGGSALLAEQRSALVNDFREALARVPAGRTPSVLLIGYADGQGAADYNVALALRRAETVADLLRRLDFGRKFHTEVTSGGISKSTPTDQARRVEIVVSRTAAPAGLAEG